MKLNWINLLATILILGGVVLLVSKRMGKSTVPNPTGVVSTEEAKAQFIAWLEGQMGRKLNDAEVQMVSATQVGNQVKIVMHEPLSGRVAEVWAKYKAAQGTPATQGSPPANTTLELAPSPTTAP